VGGGGETIGSIGCNRDNLGEGGGKEESLNGIKGRMVR
jgi:hypothetical protein